MTALRPISIGDRAPIVPAPQAAPILDWIALDRLVVDDAYQRPLQDRNWAAIERIARAFSWARFAPVLVAPVAGGRFAVIDGQHRCHAAMLCGFDSVPCAAVPVPAGAQAEAFAAVNSAVTRLSVQALFKARLAAGEALARRIDDIATAAGCRVLTYVPSASTRKPGEMLCVGLLDRLVRGDRADALRVVLAGLIASDRGGRDAGVWAEWLIAPLVAAVAETGADARHLAAFLNANDPRGMERAARAAMAQGTAGYDTFGRAMTRTVTVLLRAWLRGRA